LQAIQSGLLLVRDELISLVAGGHRIIATKFVNCTPSSSFPRCNPRHAIIGHRRLLALPQFSRFASVAGNGPAAVHAPADSTKKGATPNEVALSRLFGNDRE